MTRIDYLILGYIKVKIKKVDAARFAVRLLKSGVSQSIGRDGVIKIPLYRRSLVLPLFDGIECEISAPLGLGGFLIAHRNRYGALAALLVVSILFALLCGVVWDVRVEGCSTLSEEEIARELSNAGLSVGKRWSDINKSAVETRVLVSSDKISWLNINRRGVVAYVSVVERVTHSEEQEPVGYANVVAARDGIIEEITVKRGVAAVKVGDSVRAGQLLISGVIPTELGGGYCYAEGVVRGRYSDAVEVEIEGFDTVKEPISENIGSITVKIFGFDINIFKKYGNYTNECDIIEENRSITLFGKRLPISVKYERVCEYTVISNELSQDELTKRAREALGERLLSAFDGAELVRIRTNGGFTDGGYGMYADVLLRGEISKTQKFDVITENK